MASPAPRPRGRPKTGRPRRTKFVTIRLRPSELELLKQAARVKGEPDAVLARHVVVFASRKILENTNNGESTRPS